MGIALLTFSALFQGLSGLQQRLRPASTMPLQPVQAPRVWRMARPSRSWPATSPRPVTPFNTAVRADRQNVVRVRQSKSYAGDAGRLVISGRMADVCAELDRMAEREAAHEARRLRH